MGNTEVSLEAVVCQYLCFLAALFKVVETQLPRLDGDGSLACRFRDFLRPLVKREDDQSQLFEPNARRAEMYLQAFVEARNMMDAAEQSIQSVRLAGLLAFRNQVKHSISTRKSLISQHKPRKHSGHCNLPSPHSANIKTA